MQLEIYDSTLREGEQSATVTFTWEDKLKIIEELDRLGVSCIEVGMLTCCLLYTSGRAEGYSPQHLVLYL